MTVSFDFRRGGRRRSVAGPVASGRFAHLEMEDRAGRVSNRKPAAICDPHREPSIALLEAWAPIEVELRSAVDGPTFRIWLAQLHPHSLTGGAWRLACRPAHVGWIRDRFGRVIEGCARRPVEFVVCEALS